MQSMLFPPAVSSTPRGISTTPEVDALIASGSPVAMGVSGGKDSCWLAFSVMRHLDQVGHTGPRILIHSDLGRVEWKDSGATCERLAARLGLELVVVRRESGDMMDRWLSRWAANVERYRNLECVRLILPWSTPSMRFCTSELKTGVICRHLVKRFPGQTILSAVGIRRQESSGRKKAPITKPQTALTSRAHNTRGLNWNPILESTLDEVFAGLAAEDFALHEGYHRFGMKRISCAFCMMADEEDLTSSTTCPDNHDVYREQVDLEIDSTFAFQGGRWLGDVAPHLLSAEQRGNLHDSKQMAKVREAAEARIPDHLLYEEGWPKVMPTPAEAEMLADVRLRVAAAVGLDGVLYTTGPAILLRYAELIRERDAKRKAA